MMKKLIIGIILLLFLAGGTASYGTITTLYASSTDNQNLYEIDVISGVVTIASSTSLFNSVALASDDTYMYYWNNAGTNRGVGRWDPLTDTHVLLNDTDISEKNACFDSSGTLWLLDRTNSIADGGVVPGDVGGDLFNVNEITGDRGSAVDTIPMSDFTGFAAGDIAWGPDGRLYISTNNIFFGYDTVNNYIWDPTGAGTLTKMGGDYHAGLAWLGGKLYGGKIIGTSNTSGLFEIDPTGIDFAEVTMVATMPTDVTIGDLAIGVVPEPTTIALFGLVAMGLFRTRRKK